MVFLTISIAMVVVFVVVMVGTLVEERQVLKKLKLTLSQEEELNTLDEIVEIAVRQKRWVV